MKIRTLKPVSYLFIKYIGAYTLNQTVEVYLSFLVYLEESANDESAVHVQLVTLSVH